MEKPWSRPFAYLTPSHVSYSLTGAAACHPGGEGQKSGKLSANKSVSYDNPNLYMFMREYEHSAPMPKMMATSNLWVQMEIIFSRIWNGGEVSAQLKSLSEQIMTQVTGEPYEEAYIQPPKIVKDDLEYSAD